MPNQNTKQAINVHLETHVLQEGDLSNFVFDMPGQMVKIGKVLYLRFKEDDNHDGHPVPVTVKIEPNGEVLLTRSGENRIQMHFIANERVPFHYQTPFGKLPIELSTEDVNIQYKDQPFSGDLKIKYQLYNHGQIVGNYQIELHFTV